MLYGTVLSAEGEPVDGHMWLAQDAEQAGSAGLRAGNRAFAIAGLTPGTYRMTGRFDDQLPFAREVVVEAPRTRLDITLPPRWLLTVHAVTPEGEPLLEAAGKALPMLRMGRGVSVVALDAPLAGDLPPGSGESFRGGLGVFRGSDPFREKALPKTAVGVLALPPGEPVHAALMMSGAVVAQQQVAVGTPEITFTIGVDALVAETATVRVRVVDDQGAPVADAQVNLDGSFNPKSKTDAEGRIEFTKIMPGRRRVSVRTGQTNAAPLELDVAAGAVVDVGDLVVREPVAFELAFDDFDGSGGVYLFLLDRALPPGQRIDDHYCSAQNGKLQKVLLFPGRYAAVSRSEAGVALQVIDTSVVAGQVVRPALQRGGSLRLVGDATVPIQVSIATAAGLPVWRRDVSGQLGYSLELPFGDYVATMTGPDGNVRREALQLTAEGAELTVR